VADRPEPLRGLRWVVIALAVAVVPHVRFLPGWVDLLLVSVMAWRTVADARGWPLPPKWLRVAVTVAATAVVLGTYRTLNGIEAGTAFLVLMAGVKLLETRSARDLTVLLFIAWFLIFAALLRSQGLPQLPWLAASAVLTTSALLRVHAGSAGDSTRAVVTRTLALTAQALPLAVALFLLFPRLPGPFWGLSTSESARTGLGDEMTPGDVSELSASGDVAFRVRFFTALPPPEERYWRGPVLHEFDGRSWRRPRAQVFPAQEVRFSGPAVDYQITLEPHARRWLLALDLPSQWPEREAFPAYDFVLLAPQPINTVTAYRLRSHTHYLAGAQLPLSLRRKDTSLPEAGNPRAVALGRALAARNAAPEGVVRDLLQFFRSQPFEYTMLPPRLAHDPVDEFLFSTRKGFCEHYASAFTVVMRAAGVPARVVTGYQGGEFNPYGGYLIVRQSDAHAWSEVWLDGKGWVRVDPTAAVAPQRIRRGLIDAVAAAEPVPGRLRESNALWLQLELNWDVVNDFWNERIVRFNAQSQFDLLRKLGVEDPDWPALGLGLAASLAAFFVALSMYLGWKYRRPALDWPARLHAVVVRRLRRRALTMGSTEGPVAFLERAAGTCPDLAAELREVRRLYVALRYGPAPTEADLRRLKHAVNQLRP